MKPLAFAAPRRQLVVLAVLLPLLLALVLVLPSLLTGRSTPPSGVQDWPKALKDWERAARARGVAHADGVSLDQLVADGFLKPDAVRGFESARVTLFPLDPGRPSAPLARAVLRGGDQLLLLQDGSVQSVPAVKR